MASYWPSQLQRLIGNKEALKLNVILHDLRGTGMQGFPRMHACLCLIDLRPCALNATMHLHAFGNHFS